MAPSMWEQTEEMAKRHDQAGGLWLKLANDGDKAVVVFLGEPLPREVCFIDGKYVEFDDALKAQGVRPSLRVAFNVAVFASQEVRILEQGVVFFKDLSRIRDKYGLEKWAFEVQRHGGPKDPKTTYSILPEQQLSDEQQKLFQALPLHDLEKAYAGGGEDTGALGTYDEKLALIDAKEAERLVALLKTVPREAVDRFLQHFGIARIRDLPAAHAEKALAFITALQAERAAATSPAPEVDPFA